MFNNPCSFNIDVSQNASPATFGDVWTDTTISEPSKDTRQAVEYNWSKRLRTIRYLISSESKISVIFFKPYDFVSPDKPKRADNNELIFGVLMFTMILLLKILL